MIANISSSVLTTGLQNRNNSLFQRNGIITSWHQNRYICWKCSKSMVGCIVATVIPIIITSLLIIGFMAQKDNLHEYAIYSFVIFCLAFIFPFGLFFLTVVLNKIYRFYKWVRNGSELMTQIDERNQLRTTEHNHSHCRTSSSLRGMNGDYSCEESYYLTLDYRQLNERVFVNILPNPQIFIEDNPPSYEMALLCPTVQLSNPLDISIDNELAFRLDKDIK